MMIGCGSCKHKFTEATCTEPSKNSLYDEINGEPLGYDFSDATCVDASICSVCGVKNGDELGHTTSLGKCERCNEIVSGDIVMNIADYINFANGFIESTNISMKSANMSSLSDCYRKFLAATSSNVSAKSYLISAQNACGEFQELNALKSSLTVAIILYLQELVEIMLIH